MTPKDFTVPTRMLRTQGPMDAAASEQPPGLSCHREPRHRDPFLRVSQLWLG